MSNRINDKQYFVYTPEFTLTEQRVSRDPDEDRYWSTVQMVPVQPLKARTCSAALEEAKDLGYKYPIVGPLKGHVTQ